MKCQSFSPIIDKNAQILILGSMPSEQSLKINEYYGNKQNRFWQILFRLFEKQEIPLSYADKIKFLQKNKIALWDVLATCERKGSLDSAIKNEEVNDFAALFACYKNIQRICFNGQKAYQTFLKYNKTLLNEQKMDYFILPSTSPANARYGLKELLEKWGHVLLLRKEE